jgi:hypothetical protein
MVQERWKLSSSETSLRITSCKQQLCTQHSLHRAGDKLALPLSLGLCPMLEHTQHSCVALMIEAQPGNVPVCKPAEQAYLREPLLCNECSNNERQTSYSQTVLRACRHA